MYADGMTELDWEVGELLKKLDELGIVDHTIVMFTSDNGAEIFSWPDGGCGRATRRRPALPGDQSKHFGRQLKADIKASCLPR